MVALLIATVPAHLLLLPGFVISSHRREWAYLCLYFARENFFSVARLQVYCLLRRLVYFYLGIPSSQTKCAP